MGYFLIHLASAPEDIRSSTLGIKGEIAPDYWYRFPPTEIEYHHFFDKCQDAPTYEQVKLLCSIEHGGTHFGSAPSDDNHPNFAFLSKLFANKQFDKNNLFFKGYVHHLWVDKKYYLYDSIFDGFKFEKDFDISRRTAAINLDLEWNKANYAISRWYPEVVELISNFPKNIQDQIKFTDGNTKYIDLYQLKKFIEDMRKPISIDELLNG